MTLLIEHPDLANASGAGQDGRIAGVAGLLAASGMTAGRPLAVLTPSAAVVALVLHAAWRLGCPLFPLDPSLPEGVLSDLLDTVDARHVVGERDLAGRTMIRSADILRAEGRKPKTDVLAGTDAALLVATSGSTGRPKAVMLTAGSLMAAAHASAERLPLATGDAWLACLPLFHIGGLSILTRCALAGATAVLHDRFDAGAVLTTVDHRRISHLSVVPAMLGLLLEASADRPPPASLRHVLVSGAALSGGLARRAAAAGWPIRPSYGMSETASQLATLERLPADWRPGHVGRPLAGARIAVDADGRLRVRGPMLMAGYANPRLRPGDGLDDGWFLTSDAAEITDAGELVILGRLDDILVSGGHNIHPQMVEDMVGRCPGVTDVGISGRPDPLWGQRLVAVIVGSLTAEAFVDWCRTNVPSAFRPREAIKVAALPVNSAGKLDRTRLRRLVATAGACIW
jgi:O-succinylbenzoic acid--CoA ligase